MKTLLTERFALYAMVLIFSLVVAFHALVLLGIVPFEMVWGGRLKTREQMLQFETVSILLNLLMLAVVAVRAGWLRVRVHPTVLRVVLWLMTGLFALNTVGNVFSINPTERLVFTPLTLLLALLCARLAAGSVRATA